MSEKNLRKSLLFYYIVYIVSTFLMLSNFIKPNLTNPTSGGNIQMLRIVYTF